MAAFLHLLFILCAVVSFSFANNRPIPGLDFIPRPDPNYHTAAFIRIFINDPKTTDGFLATLNATETAPGDNAVACDARSPTPPAGKVCRFDRSVLGPYCTKQNTFGYKLDYPQPCILLKLDKLVGPGLDGWTPIGNIAVECHGKYPPDKDNIGPLQYYPPTREIASYFFPFNNQSGYMTPLVAVKFTKLVLGAIVFVECIASDLTGEVGRTNFEILRD